MGKETLCKIGPLLNLKLDTLPERIKLQKTVYLLGKLGFPGLIDYVPSYSLFVYGPYSPTVARDAYSLEESKGWLSGDVEFSEKEKEIINKFKDLVSHVPTSVNDAESVAYELLANIVYYRTKERINDSNDIFNKISEKHEYLNNRARFDTAEIALRTAGLI